MGDTYYGSVVFTSFGDPVVLSILHNSISSVLSIAHESGNSGASDWFPGIFCTPSFINDGLLNDRELQVFVQSSELHSSGLHVSYTGYGTTGENFIQCVCNILGLNCIISYGVSSCAGREHILFPSGKPRPYKLYGSDFTGSCAGSGRVKRLKLSDMPKEVAASVIISQARSILNAAGHLFKSVVEEGTDTYALTLAIAVSESRKYILSWYNNYMLDLELSHSVIQRVVLLVQDLEALGDIYSFTSSGAKYSEIQERSKKLCRAMLLINDLLDLVSPVEETSWVSLVKSETMQVC